MREPVDDRTAAYILETRRAFEDLKQGASQIAGVLVLAGAGADSASPDHPLLAAAADLLGSAGESLRAARATERARRHHAALLQAAHELRAALAQARGKICVDAVLDPLERAYGHLQDASRSLPGFEMVAFDHGCCALARRASQGARA